MAIVTRPLEIPKDDPISSPAHYKFGQYEVIHVLRAWLDVNKVSPYEGALWFSLMQYAFRYNKKKGLQDLKKAEFYLNKLIEAWEARK